jgi:arylsulfatase A-like enzyme
MSAGFIVIDNNVQSVKQRPSGAIKGERTVNRRGFLKSTGAGALSLALGVGTTAQESERPNIVWIVVEDMSCHFSYQGETTISTPNVDRLAAEGVVFDRAYITCPVCSPSRSAMITGMYQTTIGAHNHRSFRGEIKHELPDPVRTIPDIFREAGYYVCNGAGSAAKKRGKTDYNFNYANTLYDGPNWGKRAEGQPFFAQFQLHGGKNRNANVPNPVDSADVTLPPYYPDDPVLREDWAQYLNSVLFVDHEVGQIMDRLEQDGVADNTVVIFITDHGISHARGKQFLYEEGTRIPFIVWAPGRVRGGTVRDDFVAHIDMAATSLHFAGIPIPDYMEARTLFGGEADPRDYVVSARDRCDETVERIRSVRKGQFDYIRNFYPQRPHLQPNRYKDNKPILLRMREMYEAGDLEGHPAERLYTTPRPEEELYDLEIDPWELNNLADDPKYADTLAEMRGILDTWIAETGDKGQTPETDEVYDADMAAYLPGKKGEQGEILKRNIAQMKAWAAEGK